MRWQDLNESFNVADRRGRMSGFGGIPVRGKAGILVLVLVLVAGYYGIDLSPLLGGGSDLGVVSSQQYTPTPDEQEAARFSSVILGTTESTWQDIFRQEGRTYTPPKLVLYSGTTETTCGYGQSAMGPFYGPADESG